MELQNQEQDIIPSTNTDSMQLGQYNNEQPYYPNQSNYYQQNFPMLLENNNIPSQNIGKEHNQAFSLFLIKI